MSDKTLPDLLTDPARPPRAPTGLGTAGRNLYTGILSRYEVRYADELPLVIQAAKVADLIATLETEMADAPLTVLGSMKQTVAHPLLAELRQARAQLQSLLRALALPNEEEFESGPAKSPRHQRAVNARWARRDNARAAEQARAAGSGY